jgi:hypothetical protein
MFLFNNKKLIKQSILTLMYHIEMVRTATDSQTIENLYKRNVNEDIYTAERISIESDFQRGDEETGVWKINLQQY